MVNFWSNVEAHGSIGASELPITLSVQEGNFVSICIGTDCRALASALTS